MNEETTQPGSEGTRGTDPIPAPVDDSDTVSASASLIDSSTHAEAVDVTEVHDEPVSIPVNSAQPVIAPTLPTGMMEPSVSPDRLGFVRELLVKAQEKIQFNKQKKLTELYTYAQQHKVVTNDDVQKLLRVSDATATRYLNMLLRQGRIARVGSPRSATYHCGGY